MSFITFLLTTGFILIHIFSIHLKFLDRIPRSRFLSISGGVAVAYVFIHILPELNEHQSFIEKSVDIESIKFIEHHIYLISMIGLVVFYGLERITKESKKKDLSTGDNADEGVFWVHLVTSGIYNILIGYLLLHRENNRIVDLFLYFIAIGLHFFVVDHGLRQHHKAIYDKYGRWILSTSSFIGWVIGNLAEVDELMISILFSFLAGGIILNILKEELPEERQSSFWSFLGGSIGYSVLLLLA